jgi:DNA-binding MarR family transcriptional regulator
LTEERGGAEGGSTAQEPQVPVLDEAVPRAAADAFAVGLAMKRAQHELRLAIDAALAPLQVNTSQVWLLHTIDHHPGASNVRLAHLVFLTPQSLGQQVTQMQQRGFIERVPGDGRRLRHYLTDEGKRVCEEGTAIIASVDGDVLRDFSPDDLANLAAILRTIETRASVARAAAKRFLLTHG